MEYPHWVTNPKILSDNFNSKRLSFLVQKAALHHNPRGSVQVLSDAMGMYRTAIYAAIAKGEMTPSMACTIEAIVGKDVVSKEDLCPEKFAIA